MSSCGQGSSSSVFVPVERANLLYRIVPAWAMNQHGEFGKLSVADLMASRSSDHAALVATGAKDYGRVVINNDGNAVCNGSRKMRVCTREEARELAAKLVGPEPESVVAHMSEGGPVEFKTADWPVIVAHFWDEADQPAFLIVRCCINPDADGHKRYLVYGEREFKHVPTACSHVGTLVQGPKSFAALPSVIEHELRRMDCSEQRSAVYWKLPITKLDAAPPDAKAAEECKSPDPRKSDTEKYKFSFLLHNVMPSLADVHDRLSAISEAQQEEAKRELEAYLATPEWKAYEQQERARMVQEKEAMPDLIVVFPVDDDPTGELRATAAKKFVKACRDMNNNKSPLKEKVDVDIEDRNRLHKEAVANLLHSPPVIIAGMSRSELKHALLPLTILLSRDPDLAEFYSDSLWCFKAMQFAGISPVKKQTRQMVGLADQHLSGLATTVRAWIIRNQEVLAKLLNL